jgi:hypothetical protein
MENLVQAYSEFISYKEDDIKNNVASFMGALSYFVEEICNSDAESLKIFMATFQDLIGKLVWTPEVICKPFFNNPPYICSKAVPPSVPSILSQSLAFTTSALAAVKAILFFSVKMFRKAPVADNSGIELDHSVSNVAKPEETP